MFKKLHYGQAVIISACLSLCFFIFIPAQTFLANNDLFSFRIVDVVRESVPWCLISFMVVATLLILSELIAGRLFYVLAAMAIFCVYIESGLLSIGLPALNAAPRVFANPLRMLLDAGILMLCATVFMLLYHWIKNNSHFVVLAVTVLIVCSLFDVNKSETRASGSMVAHLCNSNTALGSVRLSSVRNVLVLILDSTPASITTELMKRDQQLRSKFIGFTAYTNNRAMHEKTARGLPGLLTGKYLEKDTANNEYMMSVFESDSFLNYYVQKDCPTYFTNDVIPPYGFSNRQVADIQDVVEGEEMCDSVYLRNSKDSPYVCLLDVVVFRIVPYALKCPVLKRAIGRSARNHWDGSFLDEEFAFNTIAKAPLSRETNTVLSVLLTNGTHGPIEKDRFGNRLPIPTHEPFAFSEYAVCLFNYVAKFMDQLRGKGIYDNSMIVICADHGSIELRNGDGTNGHGGDECILWVKPFGDKSQFAFNDEPTSNCKIADLIKASADNNLTSSEISTLLHATNRKFRAKFGRAWWSAGRSPYFYEWRYDDSGKVLSCKKLGVFKSN